MKKYSIFLILLSALFFDSYGQHPFLSSGPMVGYSEMREVMLWVQTNKPAAVKISYYAEGDPGQVFWTETIVTNEDRAFTAHLLADKVLPGNTYHYDLYINNSKVNFPYPTTFVSQTIWKWRSDPPPFRFAAGSCMYINEERFDRPGKPYGDRYEILRSLYSKKPEFMVWLGDNVYYRETDWNTRTGMEHRYTHDRRIPQLQPLLASTHHYAIWDDHDYGPNNSDRGWWMKEEALEVFRMFWANPSYGAAGIKGAITFFQWADADFFLLDNRYYRAPNNLAADDKTILGTDQLHWLFDALVTSEATFKFVVMGGQFLNTDAKEETYSNSGFAGERQEIIDFIYEQDIAGVIFLSGDRHYTELSMLKEEGEPVIYDLTTSPLTAGPYDAVMQVDNELRVPGKVTEGRNFSMIEVIGPEGGRNLVISVYNAEGDLQWDYTIHP